MVLYFLCLLVTNILFDFIDLFFALGRRFVKKNINIKKSSKVQPRQPIENPETNLTEEDPSALPSITLQIKTEPEEKSMLHSLQIYFVHFLFELLWICKYILAETCFVHSFH